MEFSFGLEHEVALVDQAGSFLDFSRLKYADLDRIIEKLPLYPGDYDQLRVGDAGIKKKRWYIECFERCNCDEQVVDCIPKGLEIRTTIQPTIQAAVAELAESYALLVKAAHCFGYRPVCVGFNPYRVEFEPDPPLTDYERTMQEQSPSPETLTQFIPMVTYGPDLNLSAKALPIAQAIDIAQKLTYYSPCLVPFSLNAPFYGGQLWTGLSARTFVRTGARPAALVFVAEPDQLIKSTPSLTKLARMPAEVGRIEFKAFDVCPDFTLYAGLLALLKGLALDGFLRGRALTPNPTLHQLSARLGFGHERLFLMALAVIEAADLALTGDPDQALLEPLKRLLLERQSPAHRLIESYHRLGSIDLALLEQASVNVEPAYI